MRCTRDKSFTRLAAHGIDKSNTLFIFTVDEGDHFVGGTPTPANCDGVNVPCDWTNQVGDPTQAQAWIAAAQALLADAAALAAGAP